MHADKNLPAEVNVNIKIPTHPTAVKYGVDKGTAAAELVNSVKLYEDSIK